GQLAAVKIIGAGKTDANEMRATASTLVALRTALSGLPFPPAALDGTLALGVGPVFPKYFELAAAAPVVPLVAASSPSTLQVKLTRSNGFDDKVNLSVEGLPAPATAKAAAIE